MNNQPASAPGTGVPSLVTFGQHRPIVAEAAFVAPSAVLIGRVTVSAGASIWYGAVLRADLDSIFIGERSNIQDGCVLHVDPGVPLSLGSDVTVGHNATLHGCTVEDQVLIGMGAIVLNGARIGENCLVGAGALVTEGKEFPDNSLIVGAPARAVRTLDDKAREGIARGADIYVRRWQQYAKGLKRIG
jgi:carbonic anhydrase/acetyltransferase-like protein (isoleucine patch superfamily)